MNDIEARDEARKRFRERAEANLKAVVDCVNKGQGVSEEKTRELRRLFVCSQPGTSKLLEVSDLLKELADKLKPPIDFRGRPSGIQETHDALQKTSEVFLELAAIK